MTKYDNNVGVYYDHKNYAGLLRRILIAIIDTLVITLFTILVLYITEYFFIDENRYITVNLNLFIFNSLFYLVFMKRSKFRTIGYILTGVKIVDLHGTQPTIFKMILRVGLLIIGPFGLIFDLIWLTSEETKQTLRDKYVGTYVIDKHANPVGYGNIREVIHGFMGWNISYQEVLKNNQNQ